MFDALRARLRARFRLHDNWHALLFRAWSVRFALIAAACDGVVMFCGFFTDAPESVRPYFATAGLLATLGAALARLMPQSNVASPAKDAA